MQKAGGSVDMGRVSGNLSVSRSLGDFFYKNNKDLAREEQRIVAIPDVNEIERMVCTCASLYSYTYINTCLHVLVCLYIDKCMLVCVFYL